MTSLNKLNYGSIIALALIALIAVCSYVIVHQSLKKQEYNTGLIKVLTEQRAHSQTLINAMLRLYLQPQSVDERDRILHLLHGVSAELQQSRLDLKANQGYQHFFLNKAAPEIQALILQTDQHLEKILSFAIQAQELKRSSTKKPEDILSGLQHVSEKFLALSNQLGKTITGDTHRKVIRLENIQLFLLWLLLTVLIIEAFFIFRPLINLIYKDQLIIHQNNIHLQKVIQEHQEYIVKLENAEEKIRIQNQELDALNQKLDLVVQKRTQKLFDKNRQLLETNRELSIRNLELDSLIYRISHDLRSPLATVLGLFSVMKFEENEESLRAFIELAEKEGQRMDRFIHAIIDFAQANHLDATYTPIDLNVLIDDCFHNFENTPGFDTLQKQIIIDGADVPLMSDELRLSMIINNLISNAIQFQSPISPLNLFKISAEIKAQQLKLTFWDNGVGIRKESLNRIFEMFYKGSEKSRGSGLGLYIVKNTIKHLRGKINVQTERGKYTQFEIIIPNMANPPKKTLEKQLTISPQNLSLS